MGDRITLANLEQRCANVNRRMAARRSDVSYQVQSRNGWNCLDRYNAAGTECKALVVCGTKRELGEYLHAMMTALDDAEAYGTGRINS